MTTPHETQGPSEWVCRYAHLVAPGGRVLDVACGYGRHVRHFVKSGHRVVAIDRDQAALESFRGLEGVQTIQADLESGPWPPGAGTFDAVLVTNYLYRPLLPKIIAAVGREGVLIYETFAAGNERFGRPANPDYLLRRNELLEWALPELQVVAFEQGLVSRPKPAVVQRICALRRHLDWAPLSPPQCAPND